MYIKNITKLMIVSAMISGVAFIYSSDHFNTSLSIAESTGVSNMSSAGLSLQNSESQSYIITAKASSDINQVITELKSLGLQFQTIRQFPLINAAELALLSSDVELLQRQSHFYLTPNQSVSLANTGNQYGNRIRQKESATPSRINASQLHQQGVRGNNVTVAVLDTGTYSYNALRKNTYGNKRYFGAYDVFTDSFSESSTDANGHGTHVSSVAVNSSTDAQGNYFGVAPDANLISVKAFDEHGMGTYADVIEGIEWLITHKNEYNIRVLNLSFSANATSEYWQDPLNRAVMKAWEAGIVVVASAGNSGPDHLSIGVPGNVPYVITVGAMTDAFTPDDFSDDYIPHFSGQGPTLDGFVKPEVIAPGGHVLGLMNLQSELAQSYPEFHNGYRYFEMSGTSQSSAVVAGAVALMLQLDPELSPDQVKCKLLSSASAALTDDESMAYSVFRQGAGLVDVQAAIDSPHLNCANDGMDITADLNDTQHYYGPADVTETGEYFVHGMETLEWNQGYGIESSGGFLWRTAFLVDGGFLWRTNLESSGGFLWRTNFVATSGGFLWRTSDASVASTNVNTNNWVDQH